MMKGNWIELNDAEQRLAKYLARRRYENARSTGRPDMKIGGQSSEYTDLNGIGAELAWCKVNNTFPDTTIQAEELPDEDAVCNNGKRVDIKATKYANGHLLATRWKDGDGVDVYCLMVGEFPRYRIAGYMDAAELLDEKRLRDFGHGKGFAATQDELRSSP